MEATQRPLVYYWIAYYNDGTKLEQYSPPDYKGKPFTFIDNDKIIKFGIYPFDRDLAERVTKAGTEARSIPFLPMYEINLTGNRRVIYYRDCFIQIEDYHICRECGKEFKVGKDTKWLDSRFPSPICPHCGAHDYFYCEKCGKKYTFEETHIGTCPICDGYLKNIKITSEQFSRERRWNLYNIGYQQIADNRNIKFILQIDEQGNCTIV